jgi:hypothetical protein
VGVSFDQRGVRQTVHLRDIGFAVEAKLLPFKNPPGGQRADAHTVADKDDDIARLIIVGLVRLQPRQFGLPCFKIALAGVNRRFGDWRRDRRRGRRALRQQRRGDQAGCQKGG